VINVSSLAGVKITENLSCIPYHLSKSALNHLTILLANALGPEVRVNAVAPGAIETPMWGDDRQFLRARAASNSPLARAGTPDEIAAACVFLAKPGYVTGQILVADGGRGIKIDRLDELAGQDP
jgi:ketoreductase RED2